jgi:hypothetical protein
MIMNDLIMMLARYLLFLLIVAAVFWLVHLPVRYTIYERKERYQHCRPIAALAALMLLAGNRFILPYLIHGLDKVIYESPLNGFFNTMTPERNYELIYMLLLIILMNLFFILLADLVLGIIRLLFRNRSFISVKDGTFTEKLVHFHSTVNTNQSSAYQIFVEPIYKMLKIKNPLIKLIIYF